MEFLTWAIDPPKSGLFSVPGGKRRDPSPNNNNNHNHNHNHNHNQNHNNNKIRHVFLGGGLSAERRRKLCTCAFSDQRRVNQKTLDILLLLLLSLSLLLVVLLVNSLLVVSVLLLVLPEGRFLLGGGWQTEGS